MTLSHLYGLPQAACNTDLQSGQHSLDLQRALRPTGVVDLRPLQDDVITDRIPGLPRPNLEGTVVTGKVTKKVR
ncbi:hypothetical protein RRG08_041387 [Elysia crispata]|uniref:Uncharacterized protein n=1 Tax=Elysia crispata TaxID=231223 RepID=A0AAE0XR37_9GAST|nr:hypothetical protein RRG08_041387 [Elysia crispata]